MLNISHTNKRGYSKFRLPYYRFGLLNSVSVSINYKGTTSEMVVGFSLDGSYEKKVHLCLRR